MVGNWVELAVERDIEIFIIFGESVGGGGWGEEVLKIIVIRLFLQPYDCVCGHKLYL